MAKKLSVDTKIDGLTMLVEKMGTRMDDGFKSVNERFESVDKKIEALAEDIADTRAELKGDILGVREQVNSIENEHLGIKYVRLEDRVEKIEHKDLSRTGR